jgi:hypothetical protein
MAWAPFTLPVKPSTLMRTFDPDAEEADYLVGARGEPPVAEGLLSADDERAIASADIPSLLADLDIGEANSD